MQYSHEAVEAEAQDMIDPLIGNALSRAFLQLTPMQHDVLMQHGIDLPQIADRLRRLGDVRVFVAHVSRAVLEHPCTGNLRVDMVNAMNDEGGNLLVDRARDMLLGLYSAIVN